MSPDPNFVPPTETEQTKKLRACGFGESAIEQILRTSAAIEYPLLNAWLGASAASDENKATAEKPTVILAPHSVDPEQKFKIGYPLSDGEQDELLRRALFRQRRNERDLRIYEYFIKETIACLNNIPFPATSEEREQVLRRFKKRSR